MALLIKTNDPHSTLVILNDLNPSAMSIISSPFLSMSVCVGFWNVRQLIAFISDRLLTVQLEDRPLSHPGGPYKFNDVWKASTNIEPTSHAHGLAGFC